MEQSNHIFLKPVSVSWLVVQNLKIAFRRVFMSSKLFVRHLSTSMYSKLVVIGC